MIDTNYDMKRSHTEEDIKQYPLNYPRIVQIANNYGIQTRVEGGLIFFLDEWVRDDHGYITHHSAWIDVTSWSPRRTYEWLGL